MADTTELRREFEEWVASKKEKLATDMHERLIQSYFKTIETYGPEVWEAAYLAGRAAADEDRKLLDSGCIMTHERDEFGEYMCERRGLNLRAAIRAAIEADRNKRALFSAVEAASDEEEDAYLIDRLGKLLAGVAIALKGEELPRHRHSYHDLPEVAQVLVLERDLLKQQLEDLRAASPAPDTSTQSTHPQDMSIKAVEIDVSDEEIDRLEEMHTDARDRLDVRAFARAILAAQGRKA